MGRTSQPLVSPTSPPRSSCSTTPDRFPTATLLCLIATQRTLPASSSSLVTPPSSSCSPASLCVSSPSPSSLPLEGLPSGTWADRRRRCYQGHYPQGSGWP